MLGFWIVRDYQIVAEFSVGNYADIFTQFFSRSRFGWALIQSIYVAVTTSVFAVIFCYFLAMGIVFCIPERYSAALPRAGDPAVLEQLHPQALRLAADPGAERGAQPSSWVRSASTTR